MDFFDVYAIAGQRDNGNDPVQHASLRNLKFNVMKRTCGRGISCSNVCDASQTSTPQCFAYYVGNDDEEGFWSYAKTLASKISSQVGSPPTVPDWCKRSYFNPSKFLFLFS